MRSDPPRRVLIIRLGALGDIVQSFAPFAAIRAHHPSACITLLTTRPYAAWLARAPWFDRIEIDHKPAALNLLGVAALARQLRGHDMVYDLQTSGRSTRYYWLAGRPAWSGIGAFRSHRDRNPHRDRLHTRERQRGQLRDAGIHDVPRPDLSWLTAGPAPTVPSPYALLVPAASATRPEKRWPAERYGDLAHAIAARGLTPVVVGAAADRASLRPVLESCPSAVDLVGRTDIPALAALAARAAFAVGNDTGPMHLAASVGCRAIVLFGGGSDPALTAPRGPDGAWPIVLRAPELAAISVDRVAAALPGGHRTGSVHNES